jgi:PAS domain S-box-containing protein
MTNTSGRLGNFVNKQNDNSLKESENRYRNLIETINDFAWEVDGNGIYTYCSPSCKDLLGYTPEEMLGKTPFSLMPTKEAERVGKIFSEIVSSKKAFSELENINLHKYGNEVILETSGVPILNESDELIGFRGIDRDITERVKAEKKITHLNQVLKAIRNVNQLITMEKDKEKLLQGVCNNLIETRGYNHAWIALYNDSNDTWLTKSAGLGEEFGEFTNQLSQGLVPQCIQKTMRRKEIVVITKRSKFCDNCPLHSVHPKSTVMAARLKNEGKIFGVFGVSIQKDLCLDSEEKSLFREVVGDIAFAMHNFDLEDERRQMEEKLKQYSKDLEEIIESRTDEILTTDETLKESENRFRNLFNSMSSGVAVYEANDDGKDFIFKDFNVAAEKMENVLKTDLIGESVVKKFPGVVDFGLFDVFCRVWKTGKPENHPISFYQDENLASWREYYVYKLPSGEIVAIYDDVTEQKTAQIKLKASEEKFSTAFQGGGIPMAISSLEDGKIIEVNKAFLSMYGFSRYETIGNLSCNFDMFMDREQRNMLYDTINEHGSIIDYELTIKTKSGEIRHSLISANKIRLNDKPHLLTAFKDITERKKMEEELRKNEKLALLGQLAGGIGHELRNPLGAIKNAIFFINMALVNPEQEIKESLDIIDEEVDTSERIINSLLDYARPKPLDMKEVNISEVFQRVLTRVTVPGRINVKNHFDDQTIMILADYSQMSQVFENLVFNAIQAMPEGGDLILEPLIESDGFLIIKIKDTGTGITNENLNRLFEPLFTTKAKGIGLGLAICRTIITHHNGSIDAESELGKGTVFKIKLPILVQEE